MRTIQLNKIYNENCLVTMADMNENMIDLTVTSPPYDDLRDYEGHSQDYEGYSFDFKNIAKELYRVTKTGGVVVWVVGDSIIDNSESGNSFRQALHFKDLGFKIHDTMIYRKAGPRFPEKIRYSQIFEYMFVFSKGGPPNKVHIIKDRQNRWAGYTNWGKNSYRSKEGEVVKTRVLKSGKEVDVKDAKRYKQFGARFNLWEESEPTDEQMKEYLEELEGKNNILRSNEWRYVNGFGFGTKDKDAYKHPAMFPEQLVEDHILSWSDENDLVYDPFMGSGTTAKMALLTNRNYIGSETCQEYVDGSLERIKGIVRGGRLQTIKDAESKRFEKESEHTRKVTEETEKHSKNEKKWQPEQPD